MLNNRLIPAINRPSQSVMEMARAIKPDTLTAISMMMENELHENVDNNEEVYNQRRIHTLKLE